MDVWELIICDLLSALGAVSAERQSGMKLVYELEAIMR